MILNKNVKDMKNIQKYVDEIINNSGFINIDKKDIDVFLNGLEEVDALKIKGKCSSVNELLENSLKEIQTKNPKLRCIRILFSLKTSDVGNLTMEQMGRVSEVLSLIDDDISITWGLSVNNKLEDDELELILLAGYNEKGRS